MTTTSERAADAALSAKVRTALINTREVEVNSIKFVTERGIAVNDNLPDLKAELIKRGAPVKDIRQLRDEIQAVTGVPKPVEFEDKVVALIEYRDGSIIDVIRQVRP